MQYDILNPAQERYTLRADREMHAAAVIILIGEGNYGLRRVGEEGEDAVRCPPFALSGEVGLGVWWQSVRPLGAPDDFFQWLEGAVGEYSGIADAADSIELHGMKKNQAVDMVADGKRLAIEFRAMLAAGKG